MKGFKRFRWLFVLLLVLLLAAAGFVIWAETPPSPMPAALAALQPSPAVQVEQDQWIIFRPTQSNPTTGFIFYPGGRIDERSYAPALHAIAAQGYLVVLVPVPLHLAVFQPDAAAAVIAALPEIQAWAVGGHSLGGAMAANFIYTQPGAVQGLVFWAAYPASSNSLAANNLAVVSIFASQDGLATREKIDASVPLLPSSTRFVEITGGNHAQFGWYGPQPGDGTPTISREAQQAQIVEATVTLLAALQP